MSAVLILTSLFFFVVLISSAIGIYFYVNRKIDCRVGEWSECSASCNGGVQIRNIITEPKNGGTACPPLTELRRSCNNQVCSPPPPTKIDCVLGEWSACNKSCGGGTQTRRIITQPSGGGTPCGETIRECNTEKCIVDCQLQFNADGTPIYDVEDTCPIVYDGSGNKKFTQRSNYTPKINERCRIPPSVYIQACQDPSSSEPAPIAQVGTVEALPTSPPPTSSTSPPPSTSSTPNVTNVTETPVNCVLGEYRIVESCPLPVGLTGNRVEIKDIVTPASGGGTCPSESERTRTTPCPTASPILIGTTESFLANTITYRFNPPEKRVYLTNIVITSNVRNENNWDTVRCIVYSNDGNYFDRMVNNNNNIDQDTFTTINDIAVEIPHIGGKNPDIMLSFGFNGMPTSNHGVDNIDFYGYIY